MAYLFLAGAVVSEVAGTLSLRVAVGGRRRFYAAVVASYLLAFTLLALTLDAGLGLGVAYGIWGAMGVALTAIFAAIIFGQPLTLIMILGLVLIIGGVLTVEMGSQAAIRKREANA